MKIQKIKKEIILSLMKKSYKQTNMQSNRKTKKRIEEINLIKKERKFREERKK